MAILVSSDAESGAATLAGGGEGKEAQVMRMPEQAGESPDTRDEGSGHRSSLDFMFQGAPTYPPVARGQGVVDDKIGRAHV